MFVDFRLQEGESRVMGLVVGTIQDTQKMLTMETAVESPTAVVAIADDSKDQKTQRGYNLVDDAISV